MESIYVVGAGGHTRSLINLLELNLYLIKGIYDDNFQENEEINGYKLLGRVSDIKEDAKIVLSIGDNQKRKGFYKKYYKRVLKKNLIHPKSIIEKRVMMGDSNQIFADVYNTKIIKTNIGQEAASLGAAAVAGIGAGLWKDFSIIDEIHKIEEIAEPIAENNAVYERILPIFQKASEGLAEVGDMLAELRK